MPEAWKRGDLSHFLPKASLRMLPQPPCRRQPCLSLPCYTVRLAQMVYCVAEVSGWQGCVGQHDCPHNCTTIKVLVLLLVTLTDDNNFSVQKNQLS